MTIQVVLFDLGGVLVDLPGLPAVDAADADHQAELWQKWIASPWVRAFEAGGCSPQDFAAGMVAEWHLEMTPQQYLTAFETWPKGLLPGAAEMVRDVRSGVQRGCLSNSNPVHWPRMRDEMGLGSLLDVTVLSFELGIVKPEPEIFDYAVDLVGYEPGAVKVLFLDDNEVNVTAALEAGLRSERTVGVDEAREVLEEYDLLT